MAIPIDPNTATQYVLESDRALPIGQQTTFDISPLSARHERELGASSTNMQAFNQTALRGGLKGWRNFKAGDGSEIPFVKDADGCATEATISRLRLDDKAELARAIIELGTSKLSAQTVGN